MAINFGESKSLEILKKACFGEQLKYQFQEFDLRRMLKAVENSKIDAAISAITMTSGRESVLDFSYPYYYSGLGIAVSPSNEPSSLKRFRAFLFSIQKMRDL